MTRFKETDCIRSLSLGPASSCLILGYSPELPLWSLQTTFEKCVILLWPTTLRPEEEFAQSQLRGKGFWVGMTFFSLCIFASSPASSSEAVRYHHCLFLLNSVVVTAATLMRFSWIEVLSGKPELWVVKCLAATWEGQLSYLYRHLKAS